MMGVAYLLSFCFCRDKDERHFWYDVLYVVVDNEMCEIFLGQENIFFCFQIVFIFYLLLIAIVASIDLDVFPLYPLTTAPQPVSHVSCIHVSLHHFIKHTSCRVHVTACRESLLNQADLCLCYQLFCCHHERTTQPHTFIANIFSIPTNIFTLTFRRYLHICPSGSSG